ncbi:hypothetical protein IH781_01905 [Patescibacteria group bacterium]|nr:hypothetical protein [Patescibacteria group bacterium]
MDRAGLSERWWWIGGGLLAAFFFWLSYTQFPLYSAIHPAYFTRARALELGNLLANDWLATTIDPWPIWTRLVLLTRTRLGEAWFSVYHFALVAIYLCSLLLIARRTLLRNVPRATMILLAAALILIHSELLGDITREVLGRNILMGTYLGVANQSLISVLLAPSVFGVFIFASIAAWLSKRNYTAAILAGLAGLMHFSHVLTTAPLVAMYAWLAWRERRSLVTPILLIGMWLAVLSPSLVYTYYAFAPTGGEISRLGNEILTTVRIPQHSDTRVCLGTITWLQVAFVALALWLIRKTRFFWLLFVPTLWAAGGTLLLVLTQWSFLGLVMPWRLSTYVVPIALVIILAALLKRFSRLTVLKPLVLVLVLAAAFYGTGSMLLQWRDYGSHTQELRDLAAALPRQPGVTVVIPDDLKDWRLATNRPAVIDFKTHPYLDREMIQWYERLKLVRNFYAQPGDCSTLATLQGRYQAHYVVIPNAVIPPNQGKSLCSTLVPLTRTEHFSLFRIAG